MITLEQALKDFDSWLDKNSLIKAQAQDTDSGNGILYLSVAIALLFEVFGDISLKNHYHSAILACFKKPGLLMRNPSGSFGLESWDDYLGISVACIIIHDTKIPRQILWYGILHFGYYNSTGIFTLKNFFASLLPIRFPHIWFLLWVAAFPKLKYVLKPFLDFSSVFVKPDSNDASGIQLAWMFEEAIRAMGFTVEEYKPIALSLPDAVKRYYDPKHFFLPLSQMVAERATKNA